MPTEFPFDVWAWWILQLCVLPPALVLGLFTGLELPLVTELLSSFRTDGKFDGPFAAGVGLPFKILFGIPVVFFATTLYLPLVAFFAICFSANMLGAGVAGWLIFVAPAALWFGTWSAGKLLNRLDAALGLDPAQGFSCVWNMFLIGGGIYLGVKAIKAGKSIITKI